MCNQALKGILQSVNIVLCNIYHWGRGGWIILLNTNAARNRQNHWLNYFNFRRFKSKNQPILLHRVSAGAILIIVQYLRAVCLLSSFLHRGNVQLWNTQSFSPSRVENEKSAEVGSVNIPPYLLDVPFSIYRPIKHGCAFGDRNVDEYFLFLSIFQCYVIWNLVVWTEIVFERYLPIKVNILTVNIAKIWTFIWYILKILYGTVVF